MLSDLLCRGEYMSTKYRDKDDVPSEVLCSRLDELANAVTQGSKGLNREFSMRIPAEHDRDADLVLSAAARRIRQLEEKLKA